MVPGQGTACHSPSWLSLTLYGAIASSLIFPRIYRLASTLPMASAQGPSAGGLMVLVGSWCWWDCGTSLYSQVLALVCWGALGKVPKGLCLWVSKQLSVLHA